MSEHDEQVQVCKYLDLLGMQYFAIPNGFKYHGILKILFGKVKATLYTAVKIKIFKEIKILKDEGMKPGIPDLFICHANNTHHGLFIELKAIRGGVLRKEQKEKIKRLRERGYRVEVCKGFKQAKKVIDEYRKG